MHWQPCFSLFNGQPAIFGNFKVISLFLYTTTVITTLSRPVICTLDSGLISITHHRSTHSSQIRCDFLKSLCHISTNNSFIFLKAPLSLQLVSYCFCFKPLQPPSGPNPSTEPHRAFAAAPLPLPPIWGGRDDHRPSPESCRRCAKLCSIVAFWVTGAIYRNQDKDTSIITSAPKKPSHVWVSESKKSVPIIPDNRSD